MIDLIDLIGLLRVWRAEGQYPRLSGDPPGDEGHRQAAYTDDLLQAIAEAERQGVSPQALLRLRNEVGPPYETIGEAIAVLEMLVAGASKVAAPAMPRWDRDTGELSIDGRLAKRIKNIAQKGKPTNVVRILDAFQEEGWPARIDDPLPGTSSESERNRRLTDAVESLCDRLKYLRFVRDGTTTGIRWEPA